MFRFGPFLLDRSSYRLMKGDAALSLTPKAIDLLFLLVERPMALVTKDDILRALWPDVAITDNAITQVVSDLRQALGDNPSAPQYVQTVPRRGYRFIAPVEVSDPPANRAADAEAVRPAGAGTAAGRARTIAVMDFTNVTGDPGVEWLSSGIAETVSNDLRAIDALSVIDRALVAEAARAGVGAVAGAVPAGLDLVVVGGFQRAGDRLRITARVVDVATRAALVHARSDGELAAVFDLQDDIVTGLVNGLRVSMPPAARARISLRETSSLEAYRALTEGRLRLEALDPAMVPGAIEDFERALAIDPRYALAHVGLAHARFWRYQASRARTRPETGELAAAITHAERAIAIDPDLAEAHSALGFFLASAERPAEAIAAARRGVALEPGNWRHLFRLGMTAWGEERLTNLAAVVHQFPMLAYAHFGAAMVHVARGDLDRAGRTLGEGLAAADHPVAGAGRFPASGLHWLLGLVRAATGDAAGAETAFDRELARGGSRMYATEVARDVHDARGLVRLAAGDDAGAAAAFEDALALYDDHARSLAGLAAACRRLGARDRGDAVEARAARSIEELRGIGRAGDAALALATRHALDGRDAEACLALEELLAHSPAAPWAGWTIPVDPAFRRLSSQTAFARILTDLAGRCR